MFKMWISLDEEYTIKLFKLHDKKGGSDKAIGDTVRESLESGINVGLCKEQSKKQEGQ